jgi:Phage minor capsid protein 2
MTTPLPQTPGDRREDTAITIGQVAADVYARAELAIIAAIAKLARRTATGAITGQAAAAQLDRTTTAVLTAAAEHTRATLDEAAAAVTAGVRDTIAADLGAEAAMQVTQADTLAYTLPLAASLDGAITTAAGNVQAALTAATGPLPLPAGTGGAAPPPSPPGWQPFRGEGDPYRYAVEGAIRDTRGGAPYSSLSYSRLQAAQKALDDLAAHGITGFTDSAGRRWDLATYVEMATRTAVSNMWDDLQAAAMVRSGVDLAVIGTRSTEGSCPHCLPWLGRTISLTGATEGYPTYDEARATGFRHPNCRCYIAGLGGHGAQDVTNPVAIDQAAQVYRVSQRQRALERRVRAAGRRYEAAITPQAKRRARADLATARAASEAHRRQSGLRMMKVTVQRRERPRGPR